MEVTDNQQVELSQSTASESVSEVSSPVGETTATVKSDSVTTPTVDPVNPSAAPVIPPAFTPNYKVSVRKKEYEIPEEFRPLMTDKEKEKQVHDLFTAHYGIDEVKSHRDQIIGEFQSYRQQTEPLLQIAQQVDYLKSKGDLGTTLQLLGWSKQDAFKWAIKEAELENLPEDQRRVYDNQREEQLRVYELEQKLKSYDQQMQTLTVQQRNAELSQAMSRSDVAQVAKSFDDRKLADHNGNPITFKDEVIKLGQAYWAVHGVDKTAEELVNELVSKYGWQTNQGTENLQVQNQPQANQQRSSHKDVPVIPNTGSGNTAPVSRKPTSLDDLKKIRQEKYGF